MAFRAYNKITNEIIDIDYWLKEHFQDRPYCPICGEVTDIKAKSSVEIKTHFAHPKGSECPSIEENHENYSLRSPVERDSDNAEKLIKWVKVNPYFLYKKCKELLDGFLKYQEFAELLNKADENQVWYYKGLTKEVLPYVLFVNHGTFPKINGCREERVYFIFDKNLYGDDLFLQKEITHIWKIRPDYYFDKIEISFNTHGSAPEYVWNYIRHFY